MNRFSTPACKMIESLPRKLWEVSVYKPINSQLAQKAGSASLRALTVFSMVSLFLGTLAILLSQTQNAYAENSFYEFEADDEWTEIYYLDQARKYLHFYPNMTCVGAKAAYDANVKMFDMIKKTQDDKLRKKYKTRLEGIAEEGAMLQVVLELIDCKD